MGLSGRAAIVTGASRGIGRAIAEALVARGARVAGFARGAAELEAVAAALGGPFVPVVCDVGQLAQVRAAVGTARAALGRIDILVNNAGIGRFGAVDAMAPEAWNEMLATNLSGVFHCIRESLAAMKEQGGGHIVNVSSIAGLTGYPLASGYNATKFALRGLGESLAKELEEFHIRVSTVFPGSTDTLFSGARLEPPAAAMPPAEVARLVVYLLENAEHSLVSEVVLRPYRRDA